MDKQSIISSGLLELYALGLADDTERALVQQLLQKHPDLQSELTGMQMALEDYASQQIAIPPTGMKETILREINQQVPNDTNQLGQSNDPLVTSPTNWLGITGWAAALALGMLSFLMYNQKENAQQNYQTTKASLIELQTNCATQETSAQAVAAYYDFLKQPTTQHIHVFSLQSKAPQVVVFWNETDKKGYINTFDLPPCPDGHTYQMWADVAGKMINMGVFDNQPGQLQAVNFIPNAESINITLEPIGGSDHPTVSMLQANGLI